MADDLMRDIKDIRLEQEKGRLTKFKIWYILILIIIAAGVGYGLWRYINGQNMGWLGEKLSGTQNQTPQKVETKAEEADTTSWKTFTDTDLGFAFKYPWEWDLDVQVTAPATAYKKISIIRANPDVIIDKSGENQEVEFWASVYDMKYSSYIAKRSKDKAFTDQKAESATLTSVKGKKYTFESKIFGSNAQQNDLVFPLEQKTIVLSYLTATDEVANITSILKSFRFGE